MDKIFVSSTFADMHTERDLVQKSIGPELRKSARFNFSNIEMVDLRWGVDTSGMSLIDASTHILNTCLNEVKNCNPYMLIFLGERYGTPVKKEVLSNSMGDADLIDLVEDEYSITAVEIEAGLLKENYGSIKDCVICIRNPVSPQISSEDDKKNYYEQSEKYIRKLEQLKQKLLKLDCDSQNIIYYDAVWDESCHRLTNLNVNGEPLQDIIIRMFTAILQKSWEKNRNLTVYEKAQLDGINLYNALRENFWGRNGIVEECVGLLNENDLLILQGKEGIGKSALAAKIIEVMGDKGYSPFYFWGGTGSYITSGYEIYLHVRKFIETHQGQRIILCIDGVDHIIRDDYIGYLRILPKLGDDIKAILTYQENILDNMLGYEFMIKKTALLFRRFKIVELFELDQYAVIEIAKGILNTSGKDLNFEVEREILRKKSSNNPLYLRLLLRRMEMVDGTELINLKSNDQLNEHFVQLIHEFPDEIPGAVNEIIKICIKQLGINGYVYEAISLIASSRNGLRQNDIYQMLCDEKETDKAITPKDFSAFRNYLDMIFNEDIDGFITLKYKMLKDLFDIHVTDREEHGNKDLILHYMRNELDKSDALRQRDEFYYVMDILDRRYYKYAMELMLEVSLSKDTTKLSDLKYYGWYAHGKKYYNIMNVYFRSTSTQERTRFLLYLVDDYFLLYDGSAEELGQIQLMYERIIGIQHRPSWHNRNCYINMIPMGIKKDYIQMKAHQIIGYIQERRGYQDRSAIDHFISVINEKTVDMASDPDSFEIYVKEIIREGSSISLDLRMQASGDIMHEYDLKRKRVIFETGIQYLIACNKLDAEVVEIALNKINRAGVDNCSTFMKDAYVDLRLYAINHRRSEIKSILKELQQFLNECQTGFEETHSMRDLINILKIYISIYDAEIKIQDAVGLKEWRRNVAPLMNPFIHNEVVNGEVIREIKKRYASLTSDVK